MWTLASFLGLWLILTAAQPAALPVGLGAAAIAVAINRRLLPKARSVRLTKVLAMAPRFLAASLAGGFDVAWRALSPQLPVEPGWISYRTSLPLGGPSVALAGELSLQPGTLVAGADGDRLLIHMLNRRPSIRARIAEEEARIAAALRSSTNTP